MSNEPMATSNSAPVNCESPESELSCRLGFGAMELIVAIAIIGIVAAIAILQLPDLQADRDQIAREELMTHLRYIHNLAVNREATTRITFDVPGNSYAVSIADANAPGGYAALKDPITQEDWIVNIPARFPGVGLGGVNINGDSVLLFSETNGIPCDASGVPIAADGIIDFDSGLKIRVTSDTGYVF